MKPTIYRHYLIERKSVRCDYDRCHYDGYNAFIGTIPLLSIPLPNIHRVKIAVDLWHKFHMNPLKFRKYVNFLFVNRHNYNGVWGKLIPIWKIKKIAS